MADAFRLEEKKMKDQEDEEIGCKGWKRSPAAEAPAGEAPAAEAPATIEAATEPAELPADAAEEPRRGSRRNR